MAIGTKGERGLWPVPTGLHYIGFNASWLWLQRKRRTMVRCIDGASLLRRLKGVLFRGQKQCSSSAAEGKSARGRLKEQESPAAVFVFSWEIRSAKSKIQENGYCSLAIVLY